MYIGQLRSCPLRPHHNSVHRRTMNNRNLHHTPSLCRYMCHRGTCIRPKGMSHRLHQTGWNNEGFWDTIHKDIFSPFYWYIVKQTTLQPGMGMDSKHIVVRDTPWTHCLHWCHNKFHYESKSAVALQEFSTYLLTELIDNRSRRYNCRSHIRCHIANCHQCIVHPCTVIVYYSKGVRNTSRMCTIGVTHKTLYCVSPRKYEQSMVDNIFRGKFSCHRKDHTMCCVVYIHVAYLKLSIRTGPCCPAERCVPQWNTNVNIEVSNTVVLSNLDSFVGTRTSTLS